METDIDHIHILLQYNPTDSISGIVSVLKQYSTYHIWQTHRHFLRRQYWKEQTFWSDGYFAASIGEVSSKTIEYYIENQGKDYTRRARTANRPVKCRGFNRILKCEYYGDYPCFRVVNHAGRLVPGWDEQYDLLVEDGVIMKDANHVDLKKCQWKDQ